MRFSHRSFLARVGTFGSIGAAALFSGGVISCSGGSSSGSSSAAPTFTEVYTNILGPQCGEACHEPGGTGVSVGMLDLSTQSAAYTNLVGVEAMGTPDGCAGDGIRVVPGQPDESVLAEKIDPTLFTSKLNCGSAMPQGGPSLSTSDIDEVEDWISAGALNN